MVAQNEATYVTVFVGGEQLQCCVKPTLTNGMEIRFDEGEKSSWKTFSSIFSENLDPVLNPENGRIKTTFLDAESMIKFIREQKFICRAIN